jgi:pentatricopeptide repeat protein
MNSKRIRSRRRQRRRKFLFSLCFDNVPYSSVVVLMTVFVLAIIPCAMPLVVRQSSVVAFDGGGLQSRSPPLRRRFRRRRLRPSRAYPSTLLLAHPVRKNDFGGGQKRTEEDTASSSSSSSPRLSSLDYNPNDSATSMQDESVVDNDELSSIKRTVLSMLRRNEMKQALDSIRSLVVSLGQKNDFDDGKYRLRASQCVDEMIQALTRQAFAPLSSSYYRNTNSNQRQAARHVQWGVDALHLQLQSSSRLADPYHLVPKMTLVNALKALTRLNEINPQLHVSSPSLKIKNQPKPQQQQQRQQKNDDCSLDDDSGLAVDASSSPYSSSTSTSSTWTAFRILQRLITGVGVRKQTTTTTPPPPLHQQQRKPNKRYFVYESDINMVLNAFSDAGQMDMAHRIVALQERTQHAPPLSPVAYSILLKGYGRLSDLHHVQLVVQHAEKNDIQPDVILLNSLIDAYINCNALDKAKAVFDQMRLSPSPSTTTTSATGTEVNETTVEMNDKNRVLFINHPCPLPNKRTYNTILKGLANAGLLQEAMAMADEMQRCRIWDDISSNTMVHAAVLAGDLALAEQLLKKHAAAATAVVTPVGQRNSSNSLKKNNKHPNVEAYTELLDGYAKAGQMANALSVLQRMRQHHIEPNQITYTCLIAGFGRSGRVKEAIKLVEFMSNSSEISNNRCSSNSRGNIRPTIVTFNALISGLLAGPQCATAADSSLSSSLLPQTSQECSPLEVESLDSRVDEALGIVRLMMKMGVPPNTVTVSTIVHALGRCGTPRVKEAMMLVEKLERQSVIPFANAQVATNLIRTCGIGNDLKGAVTSFRKLKTPDVIAINAFMDACCRCERADLAVETFGFYFRHKDGDEQNKREADVVSYSVLISWFIKSGSTENLEAAMKYYGEMKTESLIRPDNTLVDIILKGMIRVGRSKSLSKRDVYFVASVLRDAKKLNWAEGQLERRQRAARAALTQQFRNDEVFLYSILQVDDDDDDDDDDDELFQRKGWNKVDSGFRLWGGGYSEAPEAKKRRSSKVVDIFLQKKGWNNVDSGFRIL